MQVLETEWWSLLLPPEWQAEDDEGTVLIGDRDGVGCIEISEMRNPEQSFSSAAVRAMASEHGADGVAWEPVSVGSFAGVASHFTEDGQAIREWFVASATLLLYITYSCDTDNSGMDDAAVDEILNTLTVSPDLAG